jgi:hypothetical protein
MEKYFNDFESAYTYAQTKPGCKMRFVAKIAKWIVLIALTAVVVIINV